MKPEESSGTVAERMAADKEKCAEIFKALGLSNCVIKDIARIGKTNAGQNRLLRVSLSKEEDKYYLISRSKKLRQFLIFRNCYLKPDLTFL